MNALSNLQAAPAPARTERSEPRRPAEPAGPARGTRPFRDALRSALAPREAREAEEPRADDADDLARPEAEAAAVAAQPEKSEAPPAAPAEEEAGSSNAAARRSAAPSTRAGGVRGASARAAALSADPGRPYRGVAELDPEFRARLDRVIQRMEEMGHTVEIVETARTSERQDYLFAQGRTRPGPVVTWTRDSNHERGLAADVMVDGSYDNPAGFARLAQIARAEGLRTLGARDPGHLEMTGAEGRPFTGITLAAETLPAAPARPVESPATGIARVAQVAEVAQVAAVAEVARPAKVADVAQVAQVAQVATPGAAPVRTGTVAPASPTRERSSEGEKGDGQPAPDQGQSGHFAAHLHGAAPRAALEPRVAATAPTIGTAALDRLTRVLELQESAAARPMTQMLLRVENANGGTDSIRVGLRDGAVGASIDLGGRAGADLPGRVEELQQALQKHGLELDTVRVRTARAPDGSEATRVAAAVAEAETLRSAGTRSGGDSSTPRERQGQAQRDLSDPRSDTPRQRSRREQRGGKNA